jgi:hypothetical protein
MNLNRNQIIAIFIAILSVLGGSTAQLTDLFGPGLTKIIIAASTLGTTALSSILAVITSQGGTVRDVLAMPGVDKINVNSAANQTLAAIAIDPHVDKISPTPAALQQVTETAKGE